MSKRDKVYLITKHTDYKGADGSLIQLTRPVCTIKGRSTGDAMRNAAYYRKDLRDYTERKNGIEKAVYHTAERVENG